MKRGKRWIECLLVLAVLLIAIVVFRDSRTTALHKLAKGDYSVLDDVAKEEDLSTVFENIGDKVEWIYKDVNDDGKDDLVLQENDCVMGGLKRIVGIFTETENGLARCVLWDDVDMTTFYSLGAEGLVYYFQYSGTYDYKSYYFYKCDGTWNKELIGGQDAFLVEDVTELPIDYWEETHPDMTEPGNYFRSFTVENVDGKMVTSYRLVGEEEWKRSLQKWYTPDYHAACVEETIIRCNTFGDWMPIEKGIGKTATDFYYNPVGQTIFFVPQNSETGYELALLQNYDRYEITKRDNVNTSELEWMGQVVVDYGVSGSYVVPELTPQDDEFLEVLMQRIHKEFSVREELFSYDIYLGDFARGKNDGKDCALASLALIGKESYYIWAEITKEDSGYDVWMYPSPFGLPDESVLDARNSTAWENEIDCILALDNHLMKLEKTEAMKNAFFFPLISDTAYIDVACELLFEGAFEGTAKLKVSRVPDTKLDSYYELVLTDLQGECSNCGDMGDADCYYDKDFQIVYIFVSDEEIYLMNYSENYLDIFKEVECFPPSDAYIEELRENLLEAGEHYGYFGYRLVCASGGREDTCGVEERIGFAESAPLDYHNYVAVDGDERQYVFGPNEERTEWGTNEYMGITWKENQGMVYYVNGVGAQRDHISFWVEPEADETINAEDGKNAEALTDEAIWPYYVEEKVYLVEEEGVSIEIFYPALHGFADKETEKKVNQLIAEDCLRLIPDEVNEEPSEGRVVCAYLDYEIKFMNYNMVSIYYEGLTGCTTPGSGLEASAMATTINLETMEVVTLSDFITDFEELSALLRADFFENITRWEGSPGIDTISWEYGENEEDLFLEALKGNPKDYRYIDWYTDGSNLVIVAVNGGIEDYDEYAASIESLQYLMNEEFYEQLTEETDVSLVKFTEWYELYELDNWDRYIYVIKNADGEFVFSEMVYKEPSITLYDDRYLEAWNGAGTGVWWCRYIDMKNETVSEDYICAFYAEGGVVGWVDVKENGDRTLRLENVFSPDKYSWDIAVDFAPEEELLVESSCLREILRIEDKEVEISYINSEGIETKGWFPVDGWIEPEVAQLDILVDDICTDAKLIEEHPVLSEFLRDDLEFEKEFCEEFGSVPATMEYFTFDFNDDGLEDYFTCYYGSAWCGTQGNSIRIYVQEEGELRSVLCVTARVHGEFAGGGHAPISILQTKTEDFFDIVLPTRESSAVWRYNAESRKYEFLYEIEE